MQRFSEKLKTGLRAVGGFFKSLWQTSLSPFFCKIGRVFTTEKCKKFGRNILSGKINFLSVAALLALYGILISAIVTIFSTNGQALSSILFYNSDDFFMDFFNPMSDSDYPGLYKEYRILYTPLVNIPLNLMLHLIPQYEYLDAFGLRSTQVGMLCFCLAFIPVSIAFAVLLYKEKKGTPVEKVLFVVAMYLSVGMISVFDRGNVIIYAIFFSSAFLAFYRSEKWWVREISYVCLALAVCIKIYPVFLGILILRDKQWTGALRTMIYGLVLLIMPFLYYGNMAENIYYFFISIFNFGGAEVPEIQVSNPILPMEGMTEIVDGEERHFFYSYSGQIVYFDYIDGKTAFSFTGSFQILFAMLYKNYETLAVSEKLAKGILFLCFVASLFQNDEWKSATLLTIFSFTFTSSTYTYSLGFMILPFVMFLNKANFKNPLHWIYAALFIAILGSVVWPEQYFHVDNWYQNEEFYYLNYTNIVQRFSVLIMTFLLICEGVFHTILLLEDFIIFCIRKHKQRELRAKVEVKPATVRK